MRQRGGQLHHAGGGIDGGGLQRGDLVLAKRLAHNVEAARKWRIAETALRLTAKQAEIARRAFRRYGRGKYSAKLNFGDCFAYALAQDESVPLLFKGGDFGQTDVAVTDH